MGFGELWSGGLFSLLMKGEIDTAWYICLAIGFFLTAIVIPYLLGSINSAVIISRLLYRDDIRKHGSGNAGMTNMLRTYGKGAAGLTLLGDLTKTALAIVIGSFLMGNYLIGWTACLFCMVGHIFPIFHRFHGGKGVLCAAVGVLILSPATFLCVFGIFVLLVAVTRYVSLGSVVGGLMLPLIINARLLPGGGVLDGVVAVIMALLILWCHRGNLKRIQNRTESKLTFKKKKDEDK